MQSRNKQIWLTHSWISDEFSLLIHSKSKLSTAALLSDIFYLTFPSFSRFNFFKLVNLLLENEASVTIRNKKQLTPLQYAQVRIWRSCICHGCRQTVREL